MFSPHTNKGYLCKAMKVLTNSIVVIISILENVSDYHVVHLKLINMFYTNGISKLEKNMFPVDTPKPKFYGTKRQQIHIDGTSIRDCPFISEWENYLPLV